MRNNEYSALGSVWQEPDPSQASSMALILCILGKFLGVVCHCFPPRLDVPTFAARCLHVLKDARDPSSEMCLHDVYIQAIRDLLHTANLRHGTDGFTSPPKEGVLY